MTVSKKFKDFLVQKVNLYATRFYPRECNQHFIFCPVSNIGYFVMALHAICKKAVWKLRQIFLNLKLTLGPRFSMLQPSMTIFRNL